MLQERPLCCSLFCCPLCSCACIASVVLTLCCSTHQQYINCAHAHVRLLVNVACFYLYWQLCGLIFLQWGRVPLIQLGRGSLHGMPCRDSLVGLSPSTVREPTVRACQLVPARIYQWSSSSACVVEATHCLQVVSDSCVLPQLMLQLVLPSVCLSPVLLQPFAGLCCHATAYCSMHLH